MKGDRRSPGHRPARGIRVTGGDLRGRTIRVPAGARPTVGRVREALFSIWQEVLPAARLLDLFAGSGVVGVEALSRGALAVLAVELDPRALRLLERNARELGLEGVLRIRRGEAFDVLEMLGREEAGAFELVFADPPYSFTDHARLLRAVEPLLARDGQVAFEHSSRTRSPLEAGSLVRTDVRRYGESCLSFYRRPLESNPIF